MQKILVAIQIVLQSSKMLCDVSQCFDTSKKCA